jgi:hypothetical protein
MPYRFLVGLLVVVELALAASPAHAQNALAAKTADRPKLEERLANLGRVDVIVELKGPALPPPGTAELSAHLSTVRGAQDTFLRALYGTSDPAVLASSGRPLRRKPLSPTVGLTVTRAELERIANDPNVNRIHYDAPLDPMAGEVLSVTNSTMAHSVASATGLDQIVAVIDTGFDIDHRALSGRIAAESCFSGGTVDWLSLCPDGTVEQHGAGAARLCTNHPDCPHGTQVAGLVAGVQRRPYHVGPSDRTDPVQFGLAPYGSIYAIQAYALNLPTGQLQLVTSNLLRALEYIYVNRGSFAPRKIAAVNISAGSKEVHSASCPGHALAPIIHQLRQANIPTVIAAGNESVKDAVSEPGCIPDAITVAASTLQDTRTDFSNMAEVVDVIAPGKEVWTTYPGDNNGNASGTSIAAPVVSGAIAQIRSALPGASVDDIERAFKVTGKYIQDGNLFKPRIDVLATIEKIPGARILWGSYAPTFAGIPGGWHSPTDIPLTLRTSSGSANWQLDNIPSWLDVTPQSGTATTTPSSIVFKLSAAASTLPAGEHRVRVRIRNTSGGQPDKIWTVSLNLTAEDTARLIVVPFVSPEPDITFHAMEGGGGFSAGHPPAMDYQVYRLSSRGPLNWTVNGAPAWLNVIPLRGSLPSSDDRVSALPTQEMSRLPAGTHRATLQFSYDASSPPVTRNAIVVIYPTGSTKLTVKGPRQIDFLGGEGGGFFPVQSTLQFVSSGPPVSWTLENVPPWITASETTGTTPSTVTLTTNAITANLPFGYRAQNLEIRNSTNYEPPIVIESTLSIGPR